jgi:cysteine desulfurase
MPRHYLDHASTSPPRPEAVAAMREWLEGPTGDPGRVHQEGRLVRAAIEEAREHVAGLLGVRGRQVIFTSGGTEAANAAVWGATRQRPGGIVVCAAVEHSAVRDASERLAPVEVAAVDSTGRIEPAAVADVLERYTRKGPNKGPHSGPGPGPGSDIQRPALVHCQWANHEVGTLQPVHDIVELCRRADVPVHVDASAACGQMDLDLPGLDADLVSISAHKFGGPPGAGALIVKRGHRFEPLLVGGQQERARRAGMENVPGIIGFGAAAGALAADGQRQRTHEESGARRRIATLVSSVGHVEGVRVVGHPDPEQRLPHLVCLGVEGVEAEPVLLGLDRLGIAAHSGSACSSESLEPSPVLEAMGADPSHSLRLSVGWSTTDRDITAFADALPVVVANLRSLRN